MRRRCGCDYVNNIRGVGPVKALTLIQKHGDIEGVLEHLDLTKYPLPEPFPFKVGAGLGEGETRTQGKVPWAVTAGSPTAVPSHRESWSQPPVHHSLAPGSMPRRPAGVPRQTL